MVTMSQKSSVLQPAKTVSEALTPDSSHCCRYVSARVRAIHIDLRSSSDAVVATWFLEPDDPLNVVKPLGSRLHNAQHFLTPISKEDVHGYQHASYHYCSRSAARRRRLVRSWTLVLSDAFNADVSSQVELLEPGNGNGIAGAPPHRRRPLICLRSN